MQAAQIRIFPPFHSPFPFLSVLLAPKNGTYLTGFSGFLFWEMNAPLCTNTATLIYLLGTIRSSRVFHLFKTENPENVQSGEIVAIKLRLRLVALWHAHSFMVARPGKTHKHFVSPCGKRERKIARGDCGFSIFHLEGATRCWHKESLTKTNDFHAHFPTDNGKWERSGKWNALLTRLLALFSHFSHPHNFSLFRAAAIELSTVPLPKRSPLFRSFPFQFPWLAALLSLSACAAHLCALYGCSFFQPAFQSFVQLLSLLICSQILFRFHAIPFLLLQWIFTGPFVLALLFLLLLLFVSCGLLLLCATGSLCPLFLVPFAPPPFPRLLCFHCLCFELLCCCFPCCHFALFFLLARSPCIFIFICGLFSTAYANTRGYSSAKYYELLILSNKWCFKFCIVSLRNFNSIYKDELMF